MPGAGALGSRTAVAGLAGTALVMAALASRAGCGRAESTPRSSATACSAGTRRSARCSRCWSSRTWCARQAIARTRRGAPPAVLRRRRDRRRLAAGLAPGAAVLALIGLRGAKRRFTGSYEAASFAGNAFPTTSWVADDPRPIALDSYRLRVSGLVARGAVAVRSAELPPRDELIATLDCTGGFYSTQRWRGNSALARARTSPAGPAQGPPRQGGVAHRLPMELLAGGRPPAAAGHARRRRSPQPRARRAAAAGRAGRERDFSGSSGWSGSSCSSIPTTARRRRRCGAASPVPVGVVREPSLAHAGLAAGSPIHWSLS